MYCKHCGTQLADWQKTCHICGTPVDVNAQKTFLDDINFSESEELIQEQENTNDATKVFRVQEEKISKTQDLSEVLKSQQLKETVGMEFEDVEPQEMDTFDFGDTDFEFDDEAEMAQKERAGVIEDLFYGETDDDGEEEDELEILRESNKNKQMSIIAIVVAVVAILLIVIAIILATSLTGGNRNEQEVEITAPVTVETTTWEESRTYASSTEKETTKNETTTEEKTTEKKTKKPKETTTKEETTQAPQTQTQAVVTTNAPQTQAPTTVATSETEAEVEAQDQDVE